jgi:hypothetical protein
MTKREARIKALYIAEAEIMPFCVGLRLIKRRAEIIVVADEEAKVCRELTDIVNRLRERRKKLEATERS